MWERISGMEARRIENPLRKRTERHVTVGRRHCARYFQRIFSKIGNRIAGLNFISKLAPNIAIGNLLHICYPPHFRVPAPILPKVVKLTNGPLLNY